MNENKKIIITVVIIVALILMIPLATYINNQKGEKIVNAANELMKDENVTLAFIGRPTCGYCQLLTPVLEDYAKKYNFTYSYINTDKLTSKQYDKVLSLFKFTNDEKTNFGTPYLAFVKNGEVIDEELGYSDEEKLFMFLQKNGFISSTEVFQSSTPDLTKINYEEYNNLIASKSNQIIVLTQTGCSACNTAKPILNEIAKQYNIKINYFVLNTLESSEQKTEFLSSLSYYNDNNGWGTPLTIIVNDKKVVAAKDGYKSKDDYISFLKDNGFISK